MAAQKIRVQLTGADAHTAYVALPGHQSVPGVVSKTINLGDLIAGYAGPRVHLDFDRLGTLIGIEVLA